jgi:hypothetical protein
MKNESLLVSLCCSLLVIGFAGCGGKPDANTELEKAAKALEQAETTPTPTPAQPAQPVMTAPVVQHTPAQQMNQAMTYYKNGEYETAMANLQTLRDRTTMSAQQNMAVQSAMAAVMTDIYTRAANGDARAQQAVKQYEASKTARPR